MAQQEPLKPQNRDRERAVILTYLITSHAMETACMETRPDPLTGITMSLTHLISSGTKDECPLNEPPWTNRYIWSIQHGGS